MYPYILLSHFTFFRPLFTICILAEVLSSFMTVSHLLHHPHLELVLHCVPSYECNPLLRFIIYYLHSLYVPATKCLFDFVHSTLLFLWSLLILSAHKKRVPQEFDAKGESTVTFVTHKPFAVLFFLSSCFVNSQLFKDIRPVESQLKGVRKGRNPF